MKPWILIWTSPYYLRRGFTALLLPIFFVVTPKRRCATIEHHWTSFWRFQYLLNILEGTNMLAKICSILFFILWWYYMILTFTLPWSPNVTFWCQAQAGLMFSEFVVGAPKNLVWNRRWSWTEPRHGLNIRNIGLWRSFSPSYPHNQLGSSGWWDNCCTQEMNLANSEGVYRRHGSMVEEAGLAKSPWASSFPTRAIHLRSSEVCPSCMFQLCDASTSTICFAHEKGRKRNP